MRVIFMGTPDFAVPALQALIDSAHEVVAAYSQPPRPAGRGMKLTASPVQQLAEAHQIPVFTPTSLKTPEAQEQFRALDADIAVVAAYGLLLPQTVLDAPKFGCINIHPSDLPRGRGAAPIQRTLMAGDRHTACCIMQLELGLDTGPILLREPYEIPEEMNAGGLHDVMAAKGALQVLTVLEGLEAGTITPQPQATEGVTYAEKITKADRALDFRKDAASLLHQILGLSPYPGATVEIAGEQIKVFDAVPVPSSSPEEPGTALDNQLTIRAGSGTALMLTELQRPGKSRQPASQLLQGFPVPKGTKLPFHIEN